MGLLLRVVKKRTGRGKSYAREEILTFDNAGIFDIPYRSDVHRRFVFNEIRFRTRPTRPSRRGRTDSSSITYDLKEARRWREAILRDAPLLKGFFGEEPQWREKMLMWCEKTLAKHSAK
jgi:hypothetical protein